MFWIAMWFASCIFGGLALKCSIEMHNENVFKEFEEFEDLDIYDKVCAWKIEDYERTRGIYIVMMNITAIISAVSLLRCL